MRTNISIHAQSVLRHGYFLTMVTFTAAVVFISYCTLFVGLS
jgi:hypothetical protein